MVGQIIGELEYKFTQMSRSTKSLLFPFPVKNRMMMCFHDWLHMIVCPHTQLARTNIKRARGQRQQHERHGRVRPAGRGRVGIHEQRHKENRGCDQNQRECAGRSKNLCVWGVRCGVASVPRRIRIKI
jgi:hypothetical protein